MAGAAPNFASRFNSLTVLEPLDEVTGSKQANTNSMNKSLGCAASGSNAQSLIDSAYNAFRWCSSFDGSSGSSTGRRSFDDSSSSTSSSGRGSDSACCSRWAGENAGDGSAPPSQSATSLSSALRAGSSVTCSSASCVQFSADSDSSPLPAAAGTWYSTSRSLCNIETLSEQAGHQPDQHSAVPRTWGRCAPSGGDCCGSSSCSNSSSAFSRSSGVTFAPRKDLRRAQSDLLGGSFVHSAWGGEVSDDDDEDSDSDERAAREIKEAIGRSASMKYHRSWSSTAQAGLAGHLSGGVVDQRSGGPTGLSRTRSNYHLTNRLAAVELFLRLNHTRQTLDFVKRQTASFAALDKCELGVWDALSLLNESRDYEATLMRPGELSPDMPLLDHAFQTAELCRLRHPELEWLPLVGLIHGLGKLLAHRRFGAQPHWAVSGESFPVGCRFSPLVEGAEFFMANPDRRRRQLNTPCGMYAEHCGLTNVYMSWSAAEYLYLVLALNETSLPPEALFIIRHQKFWTLSSEGGGSGYGQLLSEDDWRMLPLLAEFQQLARYQDVGPLPDGALHGAERKAYYSALIDKYLGAGKLCW